MSVPKSLSDDIERHYGRAGLIDSILAALERAGKEIDSLTPEDLAPIDEFHVRGREATLELARAAGLDAADHVLDVGSGVGGPSRCIAAEFGCRVTGVDLTEEYCRVATTLADLVGLSHLISYRRADALDLPFPDATFDVVWTQHVSMNIPDKAALYREMNRVLKPGGRLAVYDILAGPVSPVLFPVPWARSAAASFLISPDDLRTLLESAGFAVSTWQDSTTLARRWFIRMADKIRQDGLPILGFHLLLGRDFAVMAQNQRRNLEDGRIVLVQVVAAKAT